MAPALWSRQPSILEKLRSLYAKDTGTSPVHLALSSWNLSIAVLKMCRLIPSERSCHGAQMVSKPLKRLQRLLHALKNPIAP